MPEEAIAEEAPQTISVEEHTAQLSELRTQLDTLSKASAAIGPDGKFKDGWHELLDPDLREDPVAKKFTSLNGVLKSYKNLESIKGKFSFPDASWDDEQVAEFYSNLGVPKDREAYPRMERPEDLDERIPWDDGMVNTFMDQAHKMRIKPDAAKALVEWFYENQAGQLETTLQEQKEAHIANIAQLRDEIGDKGIVIARKAAQHISEKLGFDVMADPIAGNHPAVIKMLAFVGRQFIGESVLPKLEDEITMGDAEATIADVMNNPNNPYYKGYRGMDTPTRNEKAQAYMEKMFRRKNQE